MFYDGTNLQHLATALAGWAAPAILITGFWCKADRLLLWLFARGLFLMSVHLAELGAATASATCMVGGLRRPDGFGIGVR